MAERDTLQVLVTEFQGDSKHLEAAFERIEKSSSEAIKVLRAAWKDVFKDADSVGGQSAGGFPRTAATITKSVNEISQRMNVLRQTFSAGLLPASQYRETLDKLGAELSDLREESSGTKTELNALDRATLASSKAYDQLMDSVEGLPASLDQVRSFSQTLRHEVEAGAKGSVAASQEMLAFKDALVEAAQGMDRNSEAYKRTMAAAATASRSIDTLAGSTSRLGLSQNVALGVTAALRDEVQGLEGQVLGLNSAMTTLTGNMGGFGNMTNMLSRAGTVLGAGALAGVGLAGAMHLETFSAQLEVVTSNAAEAKRVFDELDAATATAPFGFEQLSKATTQLLTFGTAAEDAVPTLLRLSDIAITVGMGVDELADAYGRAQVQGRLFSQDINQLQRRGIPIIQELATIFGVSEAAVRDLVSEGKVGFEALEQAFVNLTSEGGRFEGMAERMAGTTAGRIRTLKDEFSRLTDNIGKGLLPGFNKLIDVTQKAVDTFNALDDEQHQLMARLGLSSAAIIATTGSLTLLITAANRARLALLALGAAAGPWAWAVAGVSALAGLAVYANSAKDEVDELADALEAVKSAGEEFEQGITKAEDAVISLANAQDEQGLRASVKALAAALTDDGAEAFIAYANQAILTGEDIKQVALDINQAWIDIRRSDYEGRKDLLLSKTEHDRMMRDSYLEDLKLYGDEIAAAHEAKREAEAALAALEGSPEYYDRADDLHRSLSRAEGALAALESRDGIDAVTRRFNHFNDILGETDAQIASLDAALEGLSQQEKDLAAYATELEASRADALNRTGNEAKKTGRQLQTVADVLDDFGKASLIAAERAKLLETSGLDPLEAELGRVQGTLAAATAAFETFLKGDLAGALPTDELKQEFADLIQSLEAERVRLQVELDYSDAQIWASRLGAQMDLGLKSGLSVMNLIAPTIERLKGELRDFAAAGVTAGDEVDALNKDLAVLEELAGRIQLPEVKLQPRPDEGETSTQWLDDLRRAAKAASDAFSDDLMFRLGTLHEKVDTNAERVQFLTKELTDLWNQGRENTEVFRQYAAELKWLNDEMEHAERITAKHGQALFDNLRPIVKGAPLLGEYADLYHRVADATAAAVDPIQALRDEIEAIGGKLPTFLQGPLTLLLERLDAFEENEALKKLGENADAARERVEALLTESSDAFGKLITELEKMGEKGDLASDVVDELVASLRDAQAAAADSKAADEFEKLVTNFQQLTGTAPTQVQALRAELELLTAAGGEFAEQARRMLGGLDNLAATQFTDLLNEIQAIGAQADPFQNMTDSIRTLKEQGELTTEEIEQLMRALGDRKAELAAKSFNEMAREISRMNAEPDRFRDMAETIRKAGEDANWTTNEVDKLLTLLAEQQSIDLAKQLEDAKEAVEALSGRGATEFDTLRIVIETVRDSMVALGEDTKDVDALLEQLGAAEKTSDLVDQLGQVRDALHQIGSAAGGEFGAVLTGLGDMVDIAQKFASGDIAGAAVDVISEIVRGISEVINANAQWRESLDQLANRYKSLSREAVEAITVSRREAIKLFGLIPIGSRKVVDEQATQEGMAWATSFVSAVENALKGTDLTADFHLGLDTMVQEELIRGFTQGAAMTEAVKGIVEVFREAWEEEDPGLRDALIMSAREGLDGLQDEMEDFWEFLQENFPDLYDLGRQGGGDFTSGFTSALTGMDFTRDFNLGLDKLIQQEMIDGFLAGDDVKAAMKAAREAFAEGDWEAGRAHLELLRDSGEAFWRQMQEQFPELYEELRAGDLANALQASADAAKQLSLEASRSAVTRAFETGTASLAEYKDMLAATTRAEAELAREQAHRDLEERRRSALAGLGGQERADAAAVFDREAAAIDARFSESIADAEHEAVNAIKSILGVTTDGLAGSLRSAFDSSSFAEFTAAFGDSMRDTVRGGLIAGFLESESMKPLLVELGNMISSAIVDGTFDAATKAAIGMQVDLITETSEEFFKWLEELGYGFKDLSLDTTKLSDTVQSASESLLNVPSLFKFTQATWDAAPVQPGWASPSTYGAAAAPGETNIYVTVSGDVYGIDDFDQRVEDNARRGQEQANLATAGLGR